MSAPAHSAGSADEPESDVREAQRLGMTIADVEWFIREFPEFRCGAPTRIWCYIAGRLSRLDGEVKP